MSNDLVGDNWNKSDDSDYLFFLSEREPSIFQPILLALETLAGLTLNLNYSHSLQVGLYLCDIQAINDIFLRQPAFSGKADPTGHILRPV